MTDHETPIDSEAARHLVSLAMATDDEPLYVVAIGAPTNITSAILLEPKIIERIVVVWLGGQPLSYPTAREFNLKQDIPSVQVLLDCGVPLVLVPCMGVASHLLTTVAELEKFVSGKGAIGDYLVEIFKAYSDNHFAWSKEVWDISTIGYLLNPDWVPSQIVHTPILTDQVTWSVDQRRHFMRIATHVRRNPIFADLFEKLNNL